LVESDIVPCKSTSCINTSIQRWSAR